MARAGQSPAHGSMTRRMGPERPVLVPAEVFARLAVLQAGVRAESGVTVPFGVIIGWLAGTYRAGEVDDLEPARIRSASPLQW